MSMVHSEARVPTAFGVFRLRVYDGAHDSGPTAIIAGEHPSAAAPTLALIHPACFLSENLGYVGCECRQRLSFALETIAVRGGVVVYLRRDAGGRGLAEQIRQSAQPLVEHGLLDRPAFESAANIFRDLGISAVQLIGDDRGEAIALAAHGITVAGHVPADAPVHLHSLSFVTSLDADVSGGNA